MTTGRPVSTKHGTITLEQLAEMQPGMARLMAEFAQRFWIMYYAAKANNWDLARHMYAEMRKLGKIVPIVRPKYADGMAEFEAAYMEPLAAAIATNDWGVFEPAYRRAIEGSDAFHDRFAKPFIRYRLPPHPPEWFELDPTSRPPKK